MSEQTEQPKAWTLGEMHSGGKVDILEGRDPVATVHGIYRREGPGLNVDAYKFQVKETLALARLIAAAPEMLDVLRGIADIHDPFDADGDSGVVTCRFCGANYNKKVQVHARDCAWKVARTLRDHIDGPTPKKAGEVSFTKEGGK